MTPELKEKLAVARRESTLRRRRERGIPDGACTQCREPLTPESSVPSKRATNGLSPICKACHLKATLRWQAANKERVRSYRAALYHRQKSEGTLRRTPYDPEKGRRSNLAKLYDLTPEQYDEMLMAQGGVCATCDSPPGRRRLCIDHDHVTGEVRGLLCNPCNLAIAAIDRHGESWTVRALDYLNRDGR